MQSVLKKAFDENCCNRKRNKVLNHTLELIKYFKNTMPHITLQNRMIIDSDSTSQKALQLFQNTKAFLQDIPRRLWNINSSMNWDDIKTAYPPQIKKINYELTEMASYYLKTMKPRLPNLLDRHQITFATFEVEIVNFDINNPDSLKLAVYFFSHKYRLIASFDHYLLLSSIEENESNSQETFMLQLSADLSIHTYEM